METAGWEWELGHETLPGNQLFRESRIHQITINYRSITTNQLRDRISTPIPRPHEHWSVPGIPIISVSLQSGGRLAALFISPQTHETFQLKILSRHSKNIFAGSLWLWNRNYENLSARRLFVDFRSNIRGALSFLRSLKVHHHRSDTKRN